MATHFVRFQVFFYCTHHGNPCLHFFYQITNISYDFRMTGGQRVSKLLSELKILCNTVSKPFAVSIMNCNSLCVSRSKNNFASTLVPAVQRSTAAVVSCSAKIFLFYWSYFEIIFCWRPYEHPCLLFSIRFLIIMTVFEL